jgi:Protein of unknown function (DUF3343)
MRRRAASRQALDGLLTFFGSYHALRAESVLKKAGHEVRLVPGPRAISPNCGVALRFVYERKEETQAVLSQGSVQYEAIHHYPEQPEHDGDPEKS